VIALLTAIVHLPINALFIDAGGVPPVDASELLSRWLGWHHVRTSLALLALCVLLWTQRHALAPA
jgi:uncharacterized membrane protein